MAELAERASSTENESNQREIVVYLVRHGEAVFQGREDKDGSLTKKGRAQARTLGLFLVEILGHGEKVKFYSSPLGRSKQTAAVIRETMAAEVIRQGKDIEILSEESRSREGLTSIDLLTDGYWQLRDAGKKDPLQHWLEHPEDKPEEALKIFERMVYHYDALSKRISPEGPRVNLICVTHGGNPELFLSKMTHRSDIANLGNGELVRLIFSQDKNIQPKIIYQNHEYPIEGR